MLACRRPSRGSRAPRLVVVAGPPCAGKSLVGRHLASALAVPHLEMDRFRERVLPGSDQRVEHRDAGYRAMHFTAELMIEYSDTVIVDATYTATPCRVELVAVAARLQAGLYVIECVATAGTAVRRFLRRQSHPAVDLSAERVGALAAAYPYTHGTLWLRGGDAIGRLVTRATTYLGGPGLDQSQVREWTRRGLARERVDQSSGPDQWRAEVGR